MMVKRILGLVTCSLVASVAASCFTPQYLGHFNQLTSRQIATQASSLNERYPAYNISVPIDHFQTKDEYAPHSNGTFPLRYWFDAQYYQPGGPVIVLAGGETYGDDRLPFLQKGILYQMAKATNGIGVILEHRYYGESFPVPDLSTENLRFLTTEQALKDSVYFAENVKFPGLKDADLSPSHTPWIAYGGSYAGAFVAFLRTQYPDPFWGAISSSGVTEAIIDYWEYWEPIRIYGPPSCISFMQDAIELVDGILMNPEKKEAAAKLEKAFGLQDITHDDDFASTLTSCGIGGWQGRNWDPEISSPVFDQFCANVSDKDILYPDTEALRTDVIELASAAAFTKGTETFVNQMLNFIGWANVSIVQPCAESGGTQDECYGSYNATFFQKDNSLSSQGWRSWTYQYCTQWGYFQTSNFPPGIRPTQSRLVDLEYMSKICKYAFNITSPPNVDAINKWGGFDIEYDRLAIVDGQADPWRWATPHRPGQRQRENTKNKPFIQIPLAVHHWDENGRFENETTPELPPPEVKDAQEQIVCAVKSWVAEYNAKYR